MPGTQSKSDDLALRAFPASPVVGVGAVIVEAGELILVKRTNPPGKACWSIPGGKVELGETTIAAAIREAKEELNADIEVVKLIDCIDYIEKTTDGRVKYHYVLADFLANIVSGQLKPGSDVEEIISVSPEELNAIPLAPLTRDFLRKHRQTIFNQPG